MRRRYRRAVQLCGVSIICLLMVLCCISLRWRITWQSRSGQHLIILANGAVYRLNRTWIGDGRRPPIASWAVPPPGGWSSDAGWKVRDSGGGLDFWGTHRPLRFKAGIISTSYPLLPVMLVAGALTLLCWWWDRRSKPRFGHCRKCGYNLTGNVSGVCPECGEKVIAAAPEV